MGKILSFIMYGVAAGGLVTFLAFTVLMILDINPPILTIWLNMLGGIIMGVYFNFAALIFGLDKWSPLKKTSIHFVLSTIIYFIVALSVGWLPLRGWPILIGCIMFILVYLIFWSCFWLYFRKQEASLNDSLQKNSEFN